MSKKKELDFASAFLKLEQITQWFDSQESMDLDEGLKKFEQGLELADSLKKTLTEVENKVEQIKKRFE